MNTNTNTNTAAAFTRLADSTEALHQRFETTQGVYQSWQIVSEELNEVWRAYLDDKQDAIKHELLDVLVTWFGMVRACGFTVADVMALAEEVAAKNDAKTHDTHTVIGGGKITRR